MYSDWFAQAILVFGIMCAVIGAAIVGLCFWLVPWLWEVAKPWLHTVTA
jgi:hypothetical protein